MMAVMAGNPLPGFSEPSLLSLEQLNVANPTTVTVRPANTARQ
jgi:hypothetical protein